MESFRPKSFLTIAGMDPCGGAGVIADTKTAISIGLNPFVAITALTVQNTMGMKYFSIVDDSLFENQLEAIFEDTVPDVIKTGMISSASQTEIIAKTIEKYAVEVPLVIDPVLSATIGPESSSDMDSLICGFKKNLFPKATLVTPNIPECERIIGCKINDVSDMMRYCVEFTKHCGCKSVLLKGGHLRQESGFIDVFYDSADETLVQIFNHAVESRNLHGTGCVLSSAIASFIAYGLKRYKAVIKAIEFLNKRMRESADLSLGKGNGAAMIIKCKNI